jgi:hypothetical protein
MGSIGDETGIFSRMHKTRAQTPGNGNGGTRNKPIVRRDRNLELTSSSQHQQALMGLSTGRSNKELEIGIDVGE